MMRHAKPWCVSEIDKCRGQSPVRHEGSGESRPSASSADVSVPMNEAMGSINSTPAAAGSDSRRADEVVVESQVVARLGEESGPDEDDLRVGPGSAGVFDGCRHRLEDVLAGREVVISSAIEDHDVGIVFGREMGDTLGEATSTPRGTRLTSDLFAGPPLM